MRPRPSDGRKEKVWVAVLVNHPVVDVEAPRAVALHPISTQAVKGDLLPPAQRGVAPLELNDGSTTRLAVMDDVVDVHRAAAAWAKVVEVPVVAQAHRRPDRLVTLSVTRRTGPEGNRRHRQTPN